MSSRCLGSVLLVLLALCSATRCYAAQPLPESEMAPRVAFKRVARLEGDAYVVGRDYLLRSGEKILSLVRNKSRSDDWQQRDRIT